MRRITRAEIRAKVQSLQNDGMDIAVNYAMGQARCTTRNEQRDLSPRLPTSAMSIWLQGFTEGIRAARDADHVPEFSEDKVKL